MVILWQETDPEQDPVDLVPVDDVGHGVERGPRRRGRKRRIISLIHEDTAALQRMTVFAIVVNNADRKTNHVLAMGDGTVLDRHVRRR